jgi:predicted ribosome quality control (RQC) complex YloA/Tae2 family protein
MDDLVIGAVVEELKPLLVGRRFGKVFQLSPESFAIDFGLRDRGYLFISVEPALPRFYLIKPRLRDLEKRSMPAGQLALFLKKELSQSELISIEKDDAERVVRLIFNAQDDLDQTVRKTLIIQLTGRAANILVLGEDGIIKTHARPGRGAGQQIGELYQRPPKQKSAKERSKSLIEFHAGKSASISEALDTHYSAVVAQQAFDSQAAAARAKLRKQISQAQKLLTKLQADRAAHLNFEEHKRIGDLLLANASSSTRKGTRVALVDYFADGAPQIEIEIDEKRTLPEEASRHFAQYSRSKRALQQIDKRIELATADIAELEKQQGQLERVIGDRDEASLAAITSKTPSQSPAVAAGRKSAPGPKRVPGARQYISTDGFEILVGRAAHDNENLTFKVARPNDLWLHAADYPGSHVVVRNSTRKDLPHRTIIEAAQLAAYFSQANKAPKVDVHYTPRKFVSKIRGAAPGLVRLSRQKSITVEPREAATRILV